MTENQRVFVKLKFSSFNTICGTSSPRSKYLTLTFRLLVNKWVLLSGADHGVIFKFLT